MMKRAKTAVTLRGQSSVASLAGMLGTVKRNSRILTLHLDLQGRKRLLTYLLIYATLFS